MHTLFHDFLDCFARAAAFSNIGNLGDARRQMHELHLKELEPRQQQQKRGDTPQSSSLDATLHDINQSPTPIF